MAQSKQAKKNGIKKHCAIQKYLISRELSWLEFNRRVLHQALDETHPSARKHLSFWPFLVQIQTKYFMVRVCGP